MNEQEFNTAARNFRRGTGLSDEQKRTILAWVYEAAAAEPRPPVATPGFWIWSFSFVSAHRYVVSCSIALMAVLGGGTGYAAAHSLPGDLLYGLKVNVMEPIALAARWDDERKNDYKISLLQKRVLELEALKASGRISVETRFASHEVTEQNVAAIEQSAIFDAAGQNARVSAYVEAYNALAGAEFEVNTFIKTHTEITISTTSTSTIEIGAIVPISDVATEVIDTVANTDDTDIGVEAVDSITPIVEITVPVREIIVPLKQNLDL